MEDDDLSDFFGLDESTGNFLLRDPLLSTGAWVGVLNADLDSGEGVGVETDDLPVSLPAVSDELLESLVSTAGSSAENSGSCVCDPKLSLVESVVGKNVFQLPELEDEPEDHPESPYLYMSLAQLVSQPELHLTLFKARRLSMFLRRVKSLRYERTCLQKRFSSHSRIYKESTSSYNRERHIWRCGLVYGLIAGNTRLLIEARADLQKKLELYRRPPQV
jgi:hypothetical protein